ncbi:MAG: stage III sporulation protein AG [Lachnospiraceae bacterium]|nr:stage III sporulation protein AG [Lachnospiraceae bacterium]
MKINENNKIIVWMKENKKASIFVLAGLLLLVLTIPTNDNKNKENEVSSVELEEEDYCKKLESQMEEILSKVDGVGKVEVMITLKNSKEQVINKDTSLNSSKSVDEKEGEKSESESLEQGEETILVNIDGDSVPYVVKEYSPTVEGVLIIAQGGDNPNVKVALIEATTVLLNVPSHKVSILKMEGSV